MDNNEASVDDFAESVFNDSGSMESESHDGALESWDDIPDVGEGYVAENNEKTAVADSDSDVEDGLVSTDSPSSSLVVVALVLSDSPSGSSIGSVESSGCSDVGSSDCVSDVASSTGSDAASLDDGELSEPAIASSTLPN